MKLPFESNWYRFTDAYLIGFESVFGDVFPGLRVCQVEMEDDTGEKIIVGWNGQPSAKRIGNYKRGLFFSIENLNKVRETMRKVVDSTNIKKIMDHFDKISPYIFLVIEIGGIFDTVGQSM